MEKSLPIDPSKIKTPEELNNAKPIKPAGLWWREYISNLIVFLSGASIIVTISLALSMLFATKLFIALALLTFATCFILASAFIGNVGPVFSDKYVGIHYYKKRVRIWNKWWNQIFMYKWYLKELEELE